ncbi:cyclic nucleotide-binding domain-containing protein [Citrobacter koseri]|uniref:hypothetical protein n=1 Tax=Citrobacter koseri TaxID=545 RepID=UPI003891DF55
MFAEEAIMMIPGWNAFPQALQQALLRQSRVRSEKAGSIVFHQGAEVEAIAWTLKGHLFANVHHANGKADKPVNIIFLLSDITGIALR